MSDLGRYFMHSPLSGREHYRARIDSIDTQLAERMTTDTWRPGYWTFVLVDILVLVPTGRSFAAARRVAAARRHVGSDAGS
jgi:hypothetical protein